MSDGESSFGTPKRARREVKKEEKEARNQEKAKVKEERLKMKAEEREAKKERDLKKRIERKVGKKLAPAFGDVSGSESMKEQSSVVLADYESELASYKQTEAFLNELYSRMSKSNSKFITLLEERRTITREMTELSSIQKERSPDLCMFLLALPCCLSTHRTCR